MKGRGHLTSGKSSLDCFRHRFHGFFARLFTPASLRRLILSTVSCSEQQLDQRTLQQQLDERTLPTAARRKSDSSSANELSAARRKSDSSSTKVRQQLDESPTAARRTNSPQLDERTLHSSTKEHSGSSSTNKQLSSTKKDHGSSTDKHRIAG